MGANGVAKHTEIALCYVVRWTHVELVAGACHVMLNVLKYISWAGSEFCPNPLAGWGGHHFEATGLLLAASSDQAVRLLDLQRLRALGCLAMYPQEVLWDVLKFFLAPYEGWCFMLFHRNAMSHCPRWS